MLSSKKLERDVGELCPVGIRDLVGTSVVSPAGRDELVQLVYSGVAGGPTGTKLKVRVVENFKGPEVD